MSVRSSSRRVDITRHCFVVVLFAMLLMTVLVAYRQVFVSVQRLAAASSDRPVEIEFRVVSGTQAPYKFRCITVRQQLVLVSASHVI